MGGQPNPKGVKLEYEYLRLKATENEDGEKFVTLALFPADGSDAKVYHFNGVTGLPE